MNNLRYLIKIFNPSNSFRFQFDLQALNQNETLNAFSQFIKNSEEQLEVEVILGSGIGQLVDKSNAQDETYDRIRHNLIFLMNHIQNVFGLQIISTFTFNNFDCLLNVEDILFQLIKDQPYLKQLSISSRKDLSSFLFSSLLEAISYNRESLDQLTLVFCVKDDLTEIYIPKQLDFIKRLRLSNLSLKIQLNVFKIAKSIEEIEVSNNYNSRLQMVTIVDELQVTKNSLQKLDLVLDLNNHLQSKNCLKAIEKLHNLKSLYLQTISLKQENLDIQKLKKLEKLSLLFSDAIDYLSNHSNLHSINELEIIVGACDAGELKINQLKNLKNLRIKIKQISQMETKKTISCLEKFSQIAHQLDELTLDFSESSFFQINIMSSQLIESLGLIFEKCNENTKVNLINEKCQFNTARRFELAQQLMKVQNYQDFTLNNVKIYEQLLHFGNEISSFDLQNKFPYYLSICSQCEQLRNKVVGFSWNYLAENYSVIKKFNSFFSIFKNFSLETMPYYQPTNQIPNEFIKILPEDVNFIRLPKQFSIDLLLKNKKDFKQLQRIQFEQSQIDRYSFELSFNQFKQAFNQNLCLKFENIYTDYFKNKKIYQDLFGLEDYVIEIKLNNYFEQGSIVELFEYILNKKNIIYLNLVHNYDYDVSYDEYLETKDIMENQANLITNYSYNVLVEVLTISAFHNHFIEYMSINPKLIYLDLYF
ncbi:hypothetical protein ABPG74_020160 [Tetrahymena malaccensis]